MSRLILTVILLLCGVAGATESDNLKGTFLAFAEKIPANDVAAAPALSNGRLKPLETVAREITLYLSGKYKFWGLDAIRFYLALAVFPDADLLNVIEVRDVGVRERLGLDSSRRHFSPRELGETSLLASAQPLLRRAGDSGQDLSPFEKAVIETYHQLSIFESIRGGGHLLGVLDRSSHVKETDSAALTFATRNYLTSLIQPGSDSGATDELLRLTSAQPPPEGMGWQLDHLDLEIFYNRAQIFFWAALGYLGLGLLSLLLGAPSRRARAVVLSLSMLPLVLLVAGLALRVRITGFAPVTNMYGTMIWVGLGLSLFTSVFYWLYTQPLLSGVLWVGTAGLLFLTESLPLVLSPDLDPVVAVLRSNFWLTTHVLTITISYSAFTAAMLIGNITLIRSLYKSTDDAFVAAASHFCYRLIQLGVFLITVGIILGGVWADYSWGRFWGWDPKETWALIVAIGYLAILHARHGGHLSRFGLLATAPAAYLLVIMAWYGVNFILATGLHSYGFSSGGTRMIVGYLLVQAMLYILPWILWAWRAVRAKKTAVG